MKNIRWIAGLLTVGIIGILGPVLEARSWKEIEKSGCLRVLTVDGKRRAPQGLHRVEMPIDRERALLQHFSKKHQLKLLYVMAPSFSDLFRMLEADQGDLISANLADTPARRQVILTSEPFFLTREMVFTSAKSPLRGNTSKCLNGKLGALLPGTSYVTSFRAVMAKNKNVYAREMASTISHEELIRRVARGQYAYSVLNECDLDAWMAYYPELRKLFSIQDHVALVFGARKDSAELIRRLNQVIPPMNVIPEGVTPANSKSAADDTGTELKHTQLSRNMTGDLDEINQRGFIRMLTCNDAFSCYLHRGEMMGFEYELARRFGNSNELTLVTVIPENFSDLVKGLREGKGDFIAANFTMTRERMDAYPDLLFCTPYCGVTQVLVGRSGEKKITMLKDLQGRTVHVRKSNSYYDTLLKLQDHGIDFKIEFVPEDETEHLTLQKVAAGKYDLTVVDDTYLQMGINVGWKIKKLLELTEPQPFAWVVRRSNPHLAKAINDFFKKENRSIFFNMRKKYYYGARHAQKLVAGVKKGSMSRLSPYDALFQKYGKLYGLDWYFLAAVAYQESRFQADLVNEIGAAGLMQVMPRTAREMGISNLTNPENGIRAGAGYLKKLYDRFSDVPTRENRLCFTLAAYNAGYEHVMDARLLAARLGRDPNVWFDNTEAALAKLQTPPYASKAKFGYCRAAETIPYVNNIMLQTYHYCKFLENQAGTNQLKSVPKKK